MCWLLERLAVLFQHVKDVGSGDWERGYIHSSPISFVCSEMASRLPESTGDILETRMDESCHILHKSGECPEKRRSAVACCSLCGVLVGMYISTPAAPFS